MQLPLEAASLFENHRFCGKEGSYINEPRLLGSLGTAKKRKSREKEPITSAEGGEYLNP